MLNFAMTNFHYTRFSVLHAYHAPVTSSFYLFSSSGEINSNEFFSCYKMEQRTVRVKNYAL